MIFYRHPKTDAAPGLCYGRWNVGLAPGAEAEIAAACAAPPAFEYIVASPAWRVRGLAEALAKATGRRLEYDERLLEMNFGRWEGEFWADIDRAESDPWAENPWDLAPPSGESFSMVHSRIGAALLEAPPGGCFVTHAGPIRAAMMIQRGLSFAEAFADKVPFATPIDLSLRADG
ncbi:phosphoglycerate mutase [Pikeienuella piscinae]|uniref:Phosphoglycerate mutase n=1 Tax=Pikeienuella piscinae TaxID=2748098 RepID=A0A7M3T5U5_9RHOB|nr:histidine phosphatase family protein [Pikeienuella piscinae]QIE57376.1 phosphoglycerate mutase [Pikeienuella piscinae]